MSTERHIRISKINSPEELDLVISYVQRLGKLHAVIIALNRGLVHLHNPHNTYCKDEDGNNELDESEPARALFI
jgi:hypothetical protein